MKKVITIAVVGLLALSFAGCSGSNKNAASSTLSIASKIAQKELNCDTPKISVQVKNMEDTMAQAGNECLNKLVMLSQYVETNTAALDDAFTEADNFKESKNECYAVDAAIYAQSIEKMKKIYDQVEACKVELGTDTEAYDNTIARLKQIKGWGRVTGMLLEEAK